MNVYTLWLVTSFLCGVVGAVGFYNWKKNPLVGFVIGFVLNALLIFAWSKLKDRFEEQEGG